MCTTVTLLVIALWCATRLEVEDCVAVATSPIVAYPTCIAVHVAQKGVYAFDQRSIVVLYTEGHFNQRSYNLCFFSLTERSTGQIGVAGEALKANTDGSNATQIIVGLPYPYSIVVDSQTERIYWSYEYDNIIESSDLEGGHGQTLIAFSGDPRPLGLAIHMKLLYLGNWLANNIQSVDKYTGENLTTIYSGSGGVQQLAIANSNASQ